MTELEPEMTSATMPATEERYSIYTPDGTTWMIWDARDSAFVTNPSTGRHFGSRGSAERAIADLEHEQARLARRAQRATEQTAEPTRIKVAKSRLYSDLTRRSSPYYECTGPDGTRFDNTSIKTLREVLRRKYGRVELEVV